MTKPITPPSELVKQWLTEPEYVSGWNGKCMMLSMTDHRLSNICAKAAQYGADQELEACCDTLQRHAHWDLAVCELMADRRPKPPTLKQQALKTLDGLALPDDAFETIRFALEALPND